MIWFPRGTEQGGVERSWLLGYSHNSQSPGGLSQLLQTHHGDLGACFLAGASPGLCNNQACLRKTAPCSTPKLCPLQSAYGVWEGEAGAEPEDLAQPKITLLAWTTAQQVPDPPHALFWRCGHR